MPDQVGNLPAGKVLSPMLSSMYARYSCDIVFSTFCKDLLYSRKNNAKKRSCQAQHFWLLQKNASGKRNHCKYCTGKRVIPSATNLCLQKNASEKCSSQVQLNFFGKHTSKKTQMSSTTKFV